MSTSFLHIPHTHRTNAATLVRLRTLVMHRLSAHEDAGGSKTFTAEDVAEYQRQLDALKRNRDEVLAEAKKAKERLRDYDGVDVAEWKRLKLEAEEAETAKAKAKGDYDSLTTQLKSAHEKQVVELKAVHARELQVERDAVAKRDRVITRARVDQVLTAAIAAKGGNPKLLLPTAREFVKVRELDDDFEPYITDARGQQRFADGKATPLSFDQFVEQDLMSQFPEAFKGTGSSGGGATRSAASGGGGTKTIAAGDNAAFLANLEAVAKGEVEVTGAGG